MSIFVNREELEAVSLPDDPTNVVWIRRKMDLGTRNKVQDALMTVQDIDETGKRGAMSLNLGKSNTVLLQYNIVRWEGEKFRDQNGQPVPCTPYMIENLDPDDALVDAVLSKINELNAKKKAIGEDGKPLNPLASITASSKHGKNGSTPSTEPEKAVANHRA